jgi:hypothetical protein
MRAGWLVAIGSLGLSLASVAAAQAQTCKPLTSLDVIVSPKVPAEVCGLLASGDYFAAYSWQLFIALNWPAERGKRGKADGEDPKKIADLTAPRVWETFKSVHEVFVPGGGKPADWDADESHAVCANSGELDQSPARVLADLNQSDFFGQASSPLVAQNRTYVRYEIRTNEVGFKAIMAQELYLRAKLPGLYAAKGIELPNGTINIKAAWREVRPGENTDRYYRTEALAFDPSKGRCDKRTFVLIGLHIVQKTPLRPQWIWSTFEHVDNIEVGPDAPPGTAPSLRDPNKPPKLGSGPPPIVAGQSFPADPEPVQVVVPWMFEPHHDEREANTKWRASPQLQGTVWRFYKLVRTQWPSKPENTQTFGEPFPSRYVANSTMETYFATWDTYKQDFTCMGCHSRTQPQTDLSWFISLRAHPIDPNLRTNVRNFSDAVTRRQPPSP